MSETIELHKFSSEAELDALIDKTLREADVELDDLKEQAREGRFESEKLRRIWFSINGLGRV